MKRVLFAIVFCVASVSVFAQEEEVQYNPNSISPIPAYEHHYKIRVWRTIDLNEKQNKGFFARNGEITKIILEAVRSGELADIYRDDSLKVKQTKEKTIDNLTSQGAETYDAWDPAREWYTDDKTSYKGVNYKALKDNTGVTPGTADDTWEITKDGEAVSYLPRDISRLQIMEDIIFDRRRSRLYYDIQGVQLVIPGSITSTGVDVIVGWFKYKDLEKFFRANGNKCVWFNRENTAQNKNFADAFLMRLFHGALFKIQNPDDSSISEVMADSGRPYREGIWMKEWEEIRLMEKEHNLWEY